MKRLFDVIFSFVSLTLTLPLLVVAWMLSKYDSGLSGIFVQKRVGRHGKLFNLYKLRTMKRVEGFDTSVTTEMDPRITRSGHMLRKLKIDELPQLWNVLIGDMSIVGPRPDVTGYADLLKGKERDILSIRPGITGPASIYFKNEQELLASQDNPEKYNKEVIWPKKVELNMVYLRNNSLLSDLFYIIQTVFG